MRTTLSLDPDIASQIERLRKERHLPLKKVINDALREVLAHLSEPKKAPQHFRTREADLGTCRLNNLDDISDALAEAEGAAFR